MSTERTTPETDAEVENRGNHGVETAMADFARRLERERDEAREQLEAMRSVVKESNDALLHIVNDGASYGGKMVPGYMPAWKRCITTVIDKLKPFTQP